MRFFAFLALLFSLLSASVDINTADIKELSSLSGIGIKKAQKIVKYRREKGCFHSVEEFTKVKGIGKKTLDKNRDKIITSKCLGK